MTTIYLQDPTNTDKNIYYFDNEYEYDLPYIQKYVDKGYVIMTECEYMVKFPQPTPPTPSANQPNSSGLLKA